MFKAVIIDDELHCIERLKTLLTLYCNESIDLHGSYRTMQEGVAAVEKLQPDALFLDVELNGNTGFDLIRKCQKRDFEVIFTTAYNKYAVEAFRFSAVDYLLKPVDPDDLKEAVGKLKKKTPEEQMKRMDTLFYNIRNIAAEKKRIVVPTMQGLEFLQVNDIVRLESNVNYTSIFLKGRQKIVVAKSLKEFEELLKDLNFFRVHNCHLINLNYIKSYKKGKGGIIVMADQSEIEVSIRRKEEFLRRLSEP
jgi:two-component system LytT family response regulator